MLGFFKTIVQQWKYELLLFALIQHLFTGLVLTDMMLYRDVIWPINMLVLGIASIGIYQQQQQWKNAFITILFLMVLALPIGLSFFSQLPYYFLWLNAVYAIFFLVLLIEIIRFLVKPSYINIDIISASACGYFLMIEFFVFTLQFLQYYNPNSFKGLNLDNHASTYMDLVYYCAITMTSIGFGDILPNTHQAKLMTSLFGIAGQFYTVVLVGILISKFSSKHTTI